MSGLGRAFLWTLALVVVVTAALVTLPGVRNELVYDDVVLLTQDGRLDGPEGWGAIWTSDYWPGNRPSYNYRPLTTTSYALLAGTDKESILAQRLLNTGLHAGTGLLVLLLLSRWFQPVAATLGALLFATHPIHSEVLFQVVGRAELLSTLLGLAFLFAFLERKHVLLQSALFAGALLAKENTIVLPMLAVLLALTGSDRGALRQMSHQVIRVAAVSAGPILALFSLRYLTFGVLFSRVGYVDPLYNPLVDLPVGLRLLNGVWLLLRHTQAMLFPWPLRADYSWLQLEPISALLEPRAIGTLAFFSCLFLALVLKRSWRHPLVTGYLFFLIALLPVSNVFFPIGVMFAERLLYLPSFGFSMLVAAATAWALSNSNKPAGSYRALIAVIIVGLLAVVGSIQTVRRAADWRDWNAFTAAIVRDAPNSAHSHGLRFLHYQAEGDLLRAEQELETAIWIYPDYYDAWDSLGDLLSESGRHDEAAEAFRNAAHAVAKRKADQPEAAAFLVKAMQEQIRAGQCGEARRSLEEASELGLESSAASFHRSRIDRLCPN